MLVLKFLDTSREEVTVSNGVDDGSHLLLRMCGVLKPKPIKSSSNEIIIRHTLPIPLASTLINIAWKTVDDETPYDDVLDEGTQHV